MKTALILSVCFICVFTAVIPFLNAEENNLQKYKEELEQLNTQFTSCAALTAKDTENTQRTQRTFCVLCENTL